MSILPRIVSACTMSESPIETRSLTFFRVRTARQFATLFDDGFWSESVLQRGHHEKCVELSMVALGAMHEAFELERTPGESFNGKPEKIARLHELSVEYYAKAIGVLNSYIYKNRWMGLDVSLLCCILCVAFEWLRGNYKAAGMHLSSGIDILRQWAEVRGTTGPVVTFSSPAGHFIRSRIAPLFTRLTIQARTLDTNRPPPIPWSSAITSARIKGPKTRTVVAARADLDVVLSEIYLRAENFVYSFPDIFMKEGVREDSISKLQKWYEEYHMHIFLLDADSSAMHAASTEQLSLSIWHTMATVMLRAGNTADQEIYDSFLPWFKHIIMLTEIMQLSLAKCIHTSSYSLSKFQVDIEQIPMLYFVGSRCRHPVVRRKALDLLRVEGGREGLWDGSSQMRLLQEVIAIEEEGIEDLVDERSVPPAARIYAVAEERDLGKRSMIVSFWKQGDGCFGPARVITW
jgi:hypothetical protein